MRIALVCVLGLASMAIASVETAAAVFDVRDFGAKGDGVTLDTAAINRAIDAAHSARGGRVEFPAGDYLTYSIHLRSDIELHLGPGATILAADPPAVGEAGGYDAPEPNSASAYQDFGHSHFRNSLIWGEDLENVMISGPGRIFGKGLSRGNGRIALPVGVFLPYPPGRPHDVLRADGEFPIPSRPDVKPGPFGHPNERDTLAAGVGNKAIALKNCRNVTLRDFRILHGGHFAIFAAAVDNLTIDNLTIDTNRDGMDIDCCSNVRISNCAVNSPWDDGICLKSSFALGFARVTENVAITNCFVSGFIEGTLLDGTRQRTGVHEGGPMGRIKFGTEANGGFRNIAISNCVFEHCRGIALEQVDGGVLEDVTITNIAMRDIVNAPIFVRLGARLRAPAGAEIGKVRRILISNVVAHDVAADHGILIAGLPGHPIEDLTLNNILIEYAGGGTPEEGKRRVPEYERDYPDPVKFGRMPSWGMFARHVRRLKVVDLTMRTSEPDHRSPVWLEDAPQTELVRVNAPPLENIPAFVLTDVPGLFVRDVNGLPDSARN